LPPCVAGRRASPRCLPTTCRRSWRPASRRQRRPPPPPPPRTQPPRPSLGWCRYVRSRTPRRCSVSASLSARVGWRRRGAALRAPAGRRSCCRREEPRGDETRRAETSRDGRPSLTRVVPEAGYPRRALPVRKGGRGGGRPERGGGQQEEEWERHPGGPGSQAGVRWWGRQHALRGRPRHARREAMRPFTTSHARPSPRARAAESCEGASGVPGLCRPVRRASLSLSARAPAPAPVHCSAGRVRPSPLPLPKNQKQNTSPKNQNTL